MLHSYVLSSILTLSFTYSWYSFNGFWKRKLVDDVILGEVKSSAIPNIPIYMWDAYNKGVNSSEVDVIKSIFPKFLGPSRKSWSFQNHGRKEVEFDLPKSQQSEKLVKAKIRLITSHIKVFKISFQVYVKANKWVFLDEKKISNNTDWVSLDVTATVRNTNKSSINFLILVFTEESGKNCCEPLHPVLVLFYYTLSDDEKNKNRRKRSLSSEEYEEKTNMIWEEKLFTSHKLKKIKSNCRRKSLYIKFSDIDYDSWIVAPTGYEAFQCVGKCTFPLTEHLSPTKHAILQTLLHNISPSKAPRACCVPTKLEPISILYIDGNGVLTYRLRYRDMVVAECGCR